MSELLGSARLDLAVDISAFEAAINRAKTVAGKLGPEIQAAYDSSKASSKAASTSLIRYAELIGKSADEVKLLRAAWSGVDNKIILRVAQDIQKQRYETEASTIAAKDLAASWADMQAKARAAGKDLRETARKEAIEEEIRAVARLAAQERQLLDQRAQAISPAIGRQDNQRAGVADQQRLLRMREDATAAFGPLLQKQELENAALTREAGIRERLAAFMNTERGQRMQVTQSVQAHTAALGSGNNALKSSGIAFNQYGLSVKQTAAALRQVPAQLTDIFVGLQGGQNPLTVLIQQGGQLKDVFGGIKPAAAALGNAILGLINPYTVAAAAAVGLVVALNDMEATSSALAKSIILSGNNANVTTAQLQNMARALDDTTSASERSASAVVAQVTQSGRFTQEQIAQVSEAAIRMEAATGKAISKTIAEFAEIKKDPVEAILRLNNAISDGTNVVNFLTKEQLLQIESLKKQGREADAAKLAFTLYSDAMNTGAAAISGNLTTIAQGWRQVKQNTGDAVDAMLNGIRAVDQASARAIANFANYLKSKGGLVNAAGFALAGLFAPPTPDAKPVAVTKGNLVDPEQQKALEKFREDGLKYLTLEEQKTNAVNKARAEGIAANITDVDLLRKRRLAIETEFNERIKQRDKRGASEGRSIANAQSKSDLQDFKNNLLEEQGAIQNATNILQAQYAARLVSADEYYAQLRTLAQRGQQAEETALTGEIASLRARAVAGKDSIENLQKIGELEAKLTKVRADGATKLQVQSIQEAEFYKQRKFSIEDFKRSLADNNAELERSTNAAVRSIGTSQQEEHQAELLINAYAKQEIALRNLRIERDRGKLTAEEYAQDVTIIQDATREEVRIITDGYAARLAAQSDWLLGVQGGIKEWMAATADVASQVAQLTTSSLDKAADAFGEFAVTGKLAIKDLLRSIFSDIAKFLEKKAILQFLQAFFPGGSDPVTPSSFFGPNAKGNAYAGGTTLPSNTVLTQPTVFRFAKGGQFGIAGEAGAEAIMPLKRGRDGKLGVQATGGGTVNINVNTVVNSDGANSNVTSDGDKSNAYKEFTNEMKNVAEQTIQRALRPGGTLYRAGVSA